MQQSYRRPDRTSLQLFILKSHSLILIIDGYGQLAFGHIQKDTQDALLFKLLVSERLPIGPVAVPQLAITVEGPAELIVAKGCLQVEVAALAHPDLQLVLRPGIGHDLPIVDTLIEALVGDDCAEKVLFLLQEQRSVHRAHLNDIRGVVRVPRERLDSVLLPPDDEARRAHLVLLNDSHRLAILIIANNLGLKHLLLATYAPIFLLLDDIVVRAA